jgi:hypothetical protein
VSLLSKTSLKEMATELIRTKEEIKKMYELIRPTIQKRDGINVYMRAG